VFVCSFAERPSSRRLRPNRGALDAAELARVIGGMRVAIGLMGDAYLTGGHFGVPWDGASDAVSASAGYDNGRWSVADPRIAADWVGEISPATFRFRKL
jgi:hypothetical protein